MATDRRQFLAGLGAVALAGCAGVETPPDAGTPLFMGAISTPEGYEAAVLDQAGRIRQSVSLPARGHSGAVLPDRWAVLFARRPGWFAVAFDLRGERAPIRFAPPAGRHFYGHGIFDPDTGLLYATENDFDAARGVLGIYDSGRGFRRIGEWQTSGIGPHEIVAGPAPGTAIVANGGIETHPDWPRKKLNLPTMEPSLVTIRLGTGELLDLARPDEAHRMLSIRHLVRVGPDVWYACQDQSGDGIGRPLMGVYRPGEALSVIPGSADPALNGYIGSIATSRNRREVAITSPRGDVAQIWSVADRRARQTWQIRDVCGIAPSDDGFLFSDGQGRCWIDGQMTGQSAGAWDNHLVPLQAV
ncbi:DUF1513 domain-containing protein [Minwuia sp.]|uniref:DUF1513 domain-containing protein n=1 Tax=Minwuia sp. TaxID=2493630 RepID=UPI003A8D7846